MTQTQWRRHHINKKVAREASGSNSLCYYVMNNGAMEEEHAIFEKPDAWMMYNLKLLLIRENVDNIGVNKVFVDRGVVVNLMS